MCGRFHFGITDSVKAKQIKEKTEKLNLVFSQGEIFPTNNVLCIIPKESKIDLAVMKWGIQSKSLLINARVESIDDRPTYNCIKHNRCAIICDGFYEWDKNKMSEMVDATVYAMEKAFMALEQQDMSLALVVIEEDAYIDDLEGEINQMAVWLMAKQQPVARDL